MKIKVILALMLALTLGVASAEGVYSFGDAITIAAPADMTAEEAEGVTTLVRGATRAVIQLIPQEMSDEPLKQAGRLITAYDERVTDVDLAQTEAGVCLARGVIENCFGEGLHQYPLLMLTEHGLLIISVYDLDGGNEAAEAMREEIAAAVCVEGLAVDLPR